jgi:hypothetical protein
MRNDKKQTMQAQIEQDVQPFLQPLSGFSARVHRAPTRHGWCSRCRTKSCGGSSPSPYFPRGSLPSGRA